MVLSSVLLCELRGLNATAMPDYKRHTIKLTPHWHSDETWSCAYRIIDLSATGWRSHKGHSYGNFRSCEEAATAVLEEAKRIVDKYSGKMPLAGENVG